MYGDGWIFEGGRGGLSGGGGANGEWIWEEIDEPPDEEYTNDCVGTLYYLGMLIEEDEGEDYFAFEVLMERKNTPSIGRFSTYSVPAILDYDEDETGSLETEEYDNLPVPETAYESGEITFVSAYTYPGYYTIEMEFDGATYYSPYICSGQQAYPHDIVLATRGQDYLDSLSGDYEGTIKLWGYGYQRTVLTETEWPGVIIPELGGVSSGIGPSIINGLAQPGMILQVTPGGLRWGI